MLPDGFSRRDAMLVLQAMSHIGTIGTQEGVSGRVNSLEVMYALERMDRPEQFWDLLFTLAEDRILEMTKESRGDVRFAMADVQHHDVRAFLHQNREELEAFGVVEADDDVLTHVYLDGLEEARSRAVFY